VYKAILRRAGGAAELVAVKTLKGMSLMILLCPLRAVRSSPGVGQLIDQSGDAAKGSKMEGCVVSTIPREAREKNIRLNFQLSGWALVALSYFED